MRRWRELEMHDRLILVVDLHHVHLLELFDTRLHLFCFCRLISETFYERLYLFYLTLLVVEGSLLDINTFFSSLNKFRIRTLIIVNLAA